jgi:hypothetical protein
MSPDIQRAKAITTTAISRGAARLTRVRSDKGWPAFSKKNTLGKGLSFAQSQVVAGCILSSESGYGTQFERTLTVRSGCAGSSVSRWRRKLCLPPMSPCILNSIEIVVLPPGCRTIAPMVGVGGQHPSTSSTYGALVKWSGWSPTLVN